MKKLLFAALIAVTMGTSAFAAVNETSFKSDFKNATSVSWTSAATYAKATFVLNNVKMEAFYNLDGELIGTSKGITLDELSVNAKRNFAKKFAGYDVKEAIRFEGTDESAFYISAENDKESVVVKISDTNSMSTIKKTHK